MNYEEFENKMLELFTQNPNSYGNDVTLELEKTGNNSVKITYSAMYYNPVDNLFNFGLDLVELFGTKAIDFDEKINHEGCETCDYGSDYGQLFVINKITKNMDNIIKFGDNWGWKENIYARKRR